MDNSSYSPQMCHTCPMECNGRNLSRPGAALYLPASAATIAAFALVCVLNPEAARLFIWFPVFPIVLPVWGEMASRRVVRNLPLVRVRRIYMGFAVLFSFLFTCLLGAVFETAVNLSAFFNYY